MIKKINLNDGININVIETSKFKSNVIAYYIVRPLNKNEVTKNTLLPVVLRRATEKYGNNLLINRRLEELYGAKLGVGVLIRGNKQIIRIAVEFVDNKYIQDDKYIEEVLDILDQVVYNPKIENKAFDQDIIRKEKRNLKQRIESKINDKREYALESGIAIMCEGDSFSIPALGYIEDVDKIDEKNLYEHYKNILETSEIQIFYTGNENKEIETYFENKNYLGRKNILKVERENLLEYKDEIQEIREEMDINQGKLVMGYKTNIPYEDQLYTALVVGNVIFGGGPNSKLFLNVREKESLAYSISSRVYKYKSLIILDAGIEFDKFEATKEIIGQELDKMKLGDFSDKEIEIAKKAIISSYNSVDDNIGSITEMEFDNIISKDNRTVADKIKAIENVKKEEIIEAMKTVELDTIYFLENTSFKEVE